MESDIFIMGADGTDVARLTRDGPGATNLNPVWSPDGQLIAYGSGRDGGPGGLVVISIDGTAPKQLVRDGVLGIAWQPIRSRHRPPDRWRLDGVRCAEGVRRVRS